MRAGAGAGQPWPDCVCPPWGGQAELDVEKELCRLCRQRGVKSRTSWAFAPYHQEDLPVRPVARWAAPQYRSLLRCAV